MKLAKRLTAQQSSLPPGPEAWTPAKITTALWLDAADASTITLNGSNVSQWADKSGNGRHAVQGTAAAQPLRGANVVTFDGANDYLDFAGSESTSYALKFGTDSFAILAVFAPSAVNRNPHIVFGARGYDGGWFFGLSNANANMRMYNAAERWSPNPQTSVTLSAELQMLGATAPRGATGAIYKNGSVGQVSSSVVGSESMANDKSVRVGAYADGSNNPVGFWLGGIHEILIFPGVVSLPDWQRAEGYLAHKWALTGSLPTDHPYKTEAPVVLPLWSPAETPTALWYDPSDATSLTVESSACAQINDKSGNGLHLTQATPGSRPGVAGGKLTLNGSQGMFHIPSSARFGNYFLIASVFDVSALTTYTRPPLLVDNQAANGRPVDRWHNSSGAMNAFIVDGQDVNSGTTVDLRVINSPRIHLLVGKKDGVSPGVHSVWERLNGNASYSGSRTKTWSTASQRIALGMRSDGATSLNGWSGEVICLDVEPTSDLIAKIEGYLAHKWDALLGGTALRNALPSNHPYKTAAPLMLPLWTPTEVTTALWLDAADTTTLTITNGKVSQWNDKSGKARHAAQAVEDNMPTPIANGVQFDGTNDRLATINYTSKVQHSCFVVAEIDSTGVAVILERSYDINSYDNAFYLGVASATEFSLSVHHTGGAYTAATHNGKSTALCILNAIYEGGTTNFLYKNGVEQSKTAVQSDSGIGTSGSVPTVIASRGGISRYLNAKIREVIHIDPSLSTELRQKIEGYLAHKWDALLNVTTLRDALPSNHPYKTTAPRILPPDDYTNLQLRFNGSFVDSSKNGLIATLVGNAAIDTLYPKFGCGCLTLDGTGDCVDFPASSLFNLSSGDFTVEFWYRPTALPATNNYQALFSCGPVGGGALSYDAFLYNQSGTVKFFMWNNSYQEILPQTTAGLVVGTWYHIAYVRQGSTLRLYKNGVQLCTGSGTIGSALYPFRIGALSHTDHNINGRFDDFKFSKGICHYPDGTTFTPIQL